MDVTAAERAVLVMMTREPEGVHADPSLPEWCALLDALQRKGCAHQETLPGAQTRLCRLTPAGMTTLYLEAGAMRRRAMDAAGRAFKEETESPEMPFIAEDFMADYHRFSAEAREMSEAFDSVEWGEYGVRCKDRDECRRQGRP